MTSTTTPTVLESAFGQPKPILGMLHLKGDGPADIVGRAVREAEILVANGIDAVVVENYYGTVEDVERVLARLSAADQPIRFGVNVLDDGLASYALADRYGATFVQMDSIAGHLPPADDPQFARQIAAARERSAALLLGGVRFKYQPVLSGNSLETDLLVATERCDAVVVTGDGTGMETSLAKIEQFRSILGPAFPLVVGAGVTADNCEPSLTVADAAIVGSSLKDTRTAEGEIAAARVVELMDVVHRVRVARLDGQSPR